MSVDLMLGVAGLMTGFLVGTTGVGGGALLTPLLLLIFGVAPATAVGTDLWFAATTKLAATRVHHSARLVDWQVVRRLWLGRLPACALLVMLMKAGFASLQVDFLRGAIAAAVLLTAAGLIFQKRLHALGERLRLTNASRFKAVQMPLTVVAGALLGLIVTLTSIGAGALGAVVMTYLYPLRLTPARLVATDIVHAIPLAIFAGIGHLLIGHVDFGLLGWLLLGSVPGALLGATLSARLPQPVVRGLLSGVLVAVGARLWWPA
ncbi:MAG TPA: sulfite exporter TauE/SafE family protein [Steroidobacteraceae bacterium]|nr:sulfite exporter TauE/SafE family protein [Steroidobacteraceae bacterium]